MTPAEEVSALALKFTPERWEEAARAAEGQGLHLRYTAAFYDLAAISKELRRVPTLPLAEEIQPRTAPHDQPWRRDRPAPGRAYPGMNQPIRSAVTSRRQYRDRVVDL